MSELEKLIEERKALNEKIKELRKEEKKIGTYAFGCARLKERNEEQIRHGQCKYGVDVIYKKGLRRDTKTQFDVRHSVVEANTIQELYTELEAVTCHLMAIMQYLEEKGAKCE